MLQRCALSLLVCTVACSSVSAGTEADLGAPVMGRPGGAGSGPAAFSAPPADAADKPFVPPNVVATEHGGYALGAAITGDGANVNGLASKSGASCDFVVGVVRDFRGVTEPSGHPDFESFAGASPTVALVGPSLDAARKPVYASLCEASLVGGAGGCPFGAMTSTKSNFDQWYRFEAAVNKPYLVYLQFAPNEGVYTFESSLYFPLDGAGFGNSGVGADGKPHNFGFTTELHTEFQYRGGERFTFIGDDDVWVFMNGKLAIDLGGLHPPATGTIDLDAQAAALGLSRGGTYTLDLFQAERRVSGSTFRVDTNLAFTSCGKVLADSPK